MWNGLWLKFLDNIIRNVPLIVIATPAVLSRLMSIILIKFLLSHTQWSCFKTIKGAYNHITTSLCSSLPKRLSRHHQISCRTELRRLRHFWGEIKCIFCFLVAFSVTLASHKKIMTYETYLFLTSCVSRSLHSKCTTLSCIRGGLTCESIEISNNSTSQDLWPFSAYNLSFAVDLHSSSAIQLPIRGPVSKIGRDCIHRSVIIME